MKLELKKIVLDDFIVYETSPAQAGVRYAIFSLSPIPRFENYPTVRTDIFSRMSKKNPIPMKDSLVWKIFFGDSPLHEILEIKDTCMFGVSDIEDKYPDSPHMAMKQGDYLSRNDKTIEAVDSEEIENIYRHYRRLHKRMEESGEYSENVLNSFLELPILICLLSKMGIYNDKFLSSKDPETTEQAQRNAKLIQKRIQKAEERAQKMIEFKHEDYNHEYAEKALKEFQAAKNIEIALS